MHKNPLLFGLAATLLSTPLLAQNKTANDGDWSLREVTLKNTAEAEYMIRIGDVDNLGFGFEPEFNPFCGRTTSSHGFPWNIDPQEIKGMDCILFSSGNGKKEYPCSSEGYSGSAVNPAEAMLTQPLSMPLASIKGVEIKSAILQIFVDDFQARQFCANYQVTLNGKRWADAEALLNIIDQSGPVGKLVSIPISDVLLPTLQSDKLTLLIDDPNTSAGDGFAIDFVKLLVNVKDKGLCRGKGAGYVLSETTGNPIENAMVEIRGVGSVKTNADGYFEFPNLLSGLSPVVASAKGYNNGAGTLDVGEGEELAPINIYLGESNKQATFNGKELREGEITTLNNIQFDQNSDVLRSEGKTELDKIATFLKENEGVQIELSGHTSSEGDAALNKKLSLRRVESCKAYLVQKGIDSGRILTVGKGPDSPIAPNDSEANRAKNRRVEMRVMKL